MAMTVRASPFTVPLELLGRPSSSSSRNSSGESSCASTSTSAFAFALAAPAPAPEAAAAFRRRRRPALNDGRNRRCTPWSAAAEAKKKSLSYLSHLDCQQQQLRLLHTPAISRAPPPRRTTSAVNVRASSDSGSVQNQPSIGFLGLGIMGRAMAHNLIKAGYDVTVWNRTTSKCDPLVEEGAKRGSSPQETVAACDITFAMLADPPTAIAVTTGEEGVVKGLGPNKGYVDVSTVDGDTAKYIAEAVKSTGARYLEAPVSGSKKPAEDGALIFLAAGDKELYDQASPMLDVMGKSKYFLGDVGNGAAMKLIVNMLMGSMMASFSEGLMLGRKAGLDPETIVKVIGEGTVASPMFALKGPAMVKGAYPTAFPLKHQQKDLRLVLAMAEDLAQSIPVTASVNKLYERAQTDGHGDEDFSAVLEALKS